MRVLVTGGTGVIGSSTVTALLRHGHTVQLLSRHAERDADAWSRDVTPIEGDITDLDALGRAAEGCDGVLHLVGIIDEAPPDTTFERVNVEGTRNVVREAERAAVRRFVYVSSLGCDRGSSPYHQSKREAEDIVAQLPDDVYLSWDIDGLDPTLCPGTGTPVPGGLSWNEAIGLLRAVHRAGKRIVGLDLCEVAPGETDWDANVGARLLYKMIGFAVRVGD